MSTYGFGEVADKEVSRASINKLVKDEVLWRHYLGFDFKIGRTYKSPLRTDPTPSFSMFEATRMGGKIMGKDHGGTFVGDVIDYVAFVERIDFYSALVKVNLDFGLGLSYKRDRVMMFREKKNDKVTIEITREKPKKFIYQSTQRVPVQADFDYWMTYGITRTTLNLYKVRCVNVLYCNNYCVYTYSPRDPSYEYSFPSGNKKYYRPFAPKTEKFRGNIDNGKDVQGYYQCCIARKEKGELLVLTKSMKDVMLLREYGIDAMAIHGETQRFNRLFIEHLRRWYTRIISLYDRDKGGMCGAKYLWKEYGITPEFLPKGSAKDLTDLYRKDRMKANEYVNTKLRQQL